MRQTQFTLKAVGFCLVILSMVAGFGPAVSYYTGYPWRKLDAQETEYFHHVREQNTLLYSNLGSLLLGAGLATGVTGYVLREKKRK